MCCAVRDIDEEFFDLWKQKYMEAAGVCANREERLNDVYNEIETHLKLIGKLRKVEFILYGWGFGRNCRRCAYNKQYL